MGERIISQLENVIVNLKAENQRIYPPDKKSIEQFLLFKDYLLDGVEEPYVFVALLIAKKKYSKNPEFPSRLTVRSWIVRDILRFMDEDIFSLRFPIYYRGVEVKAEECVLYITTNPRDFRRAVKVLGEESIKLLYGNDVKAMGRLDKLVISAYMKSTLTKDKFFIDVDLKDNNSNSVEEVLSAFRKLFGDKIQLVVKTRGGLHLHFKKSLIPEKEREYIFRRKFVNDLPKEIVELTTEIDIKPDNLCAVPGLVYGENVIEVL